VSASETGPLKVALLGCGTVGSAVLSLISEQADDLTARIGRPVEVVGIAVRRPSHHPDVPQHLLTTDADALVNRADVDLVVEVIGGIEPARSLMLAAFAAGKSVVSANKALLADHGVALHAAAAEAGVDLYYEAAVAGAIPLLRPLRESLAGDQIRRVVGIVNGTTNYILSRMAETGAGFAEALAEATELGYAEADPTADVDGFDAAAKAAILASLSFHTPVTAADVYREGISAVSATDVARAAEIGCTVKLLAICERVGNGDGTGDTVAVRVHPAMIPTSHPLAAVGGAFNAVFVEAEAAGQLMFYGQGAGGRPTASAVLGDLVAVARNRLTGAAGQSSTGYANLAVRPMDATPTRYHVSLDVADKPGVLATVAHEFAKHEVSISTVRQDGRGDAATLVIVTHSAPDAALSATIAALRDMPAVRGVTSVLRVEGLS
jgi:homoserine dehydrogenase